MTIFDVIGIPVPQGSMKAFIPKGRSYPVITTDNKSLKNWRDLVSLVAQDHAPEKPIKGAVQVMLLFRLPVPQSYPKTKKVYALKRPDVDKMCRAIFDSLSGIFWFDDSQVVDLRARKELAYNAQPGVTIVIEELGEIAGFLPPESIQDQLPILERAE